MESSKTNYSIDTFVRIIILSVLLLWSFFIVKSFILLIVWAIIIAVTLYPLYQKVITLFKGKRKGLISTLFILILLAIIIVPIINITQSVLGSSSEIYKNFEEGTLKLPPPDSSVRDWPLIGENIYSLWNNASSDIESFIKSHPDEIKNSAGWVFSSFTGLMGSVLLSIVALIIAGIFMASGEEGFKTGVNFANKLVKGKGVALIEMCSNTIRSVVKGILLVAVIQAILAYAGFAVVGLSSMAGILAIIVMFAAIIQIPVSLVVIPIIIYVFTFADTTPAIIFAIYMIIVSLLDNVLKPMLLAKGLQTPMIIILIGAIGGMMFQGILGLFIGPVILAIVHRLYINWVNDTEMT